MPGKIKYRPYTKADEDALIRIVDQDFWEWGLDFDYEDVKDYRAYVMGFIPKACEVWVLVDGMKIVGAVALCDEKGRGQSGDVGVMMVAGTRLRARPLAMTRVAKEFLSFVSMRFKGQVWACIDDHSIRDRLWARTIGLMPTDIVAGNMRYWEYIKLWQQ